VELPWMWRDCRNFGLRDFNFIILILFNISLLANLKNNRVQENVQIIIFI
jgi:hypothetical protein